VMLGDEHADDACFTVFIGNLQRRDGLEVAVLAKWFGPCEHSMGEHIWV
jgi:hypothetical protein